jgi:hypothetical protein
MEIMDSLFNKKRRISKWRVVFVILLIVHLGLGCWILFGMDSGRDIGMGIFILIPFLGVLAIIDFIAILSYVITQHPQGIARDISYAILVPLGLLLMYIVYILFGWWWNYYH